MNAKQTRPSIELSAEEMEKLRQLSVSRTEPYDQVTRARIILAYQEGESKSAIARFVGVSRPTVDLCINKALCAGVQVAIRDLRRPGRPNIITADDKAWLVSVACSKPTDYGYAAETWTHSHLAKHMRKNAKASGYPSLRGAGKVTVLRISSKSMRLGPTRLPTTWRNVTRNSRRRWHRKSSFLRRLKCFV